MCSVNLLYIFGVPIVLIAGVGMGILTFLGLKKRKEERKTGSKVVPFKRKEVAAKPKTFKEEQDDVWHNWNRDYRKGSKR